MKFKKTKAVITHIGKKAEEPLVKYPKPKILLIDVEDDAEKVLAAKGYNVASGTFGNPYKVKKADSRQPVIAESKLPNFAEQDIVIVDLKEPSLLTGPKGEKAVSDGEDDWWASCTTGKIDPRPRAMANSASFFDRILEHGGAFVIFADFRVQQDLLFGHCRSGYGVVGDALKFDNWSFLDCLDGDSLTADVDSGSEITVVDGTVFASTLANHLRGTEFRCVLSRRYRTSRKNWVPLAKNKFDKTVSVFVGHAFGEGQLTGVLIVPQIRDKAGFLCELLDDALPQLLPHLFPYCEGDVWVHRPEYELPRVLELGERIDKIRQEKENEIEKVQAEIRGVQKDNQFLYE